jgi:hypothetical protein
MACAGKTWLVSSSLLREEAAEVRGKKNLSFPASGVDLHVSDQGLKRADGRMKLVLREPEPQPKSLAYSVLVGSLPRWPLSLSLLLLLRKAASGSEGE